MTQNDPTNVLAAFEMLLEEMEDEIEFVNKAGAKAFMAGSYDRVAAARDHAQQLTALREQAGDLRRKWEALTGAFNLDADQDEEEKSARRNLGRLQRGTRTPEEAFKIPILQTLKDLGGSAPLGNVLERVEKRMRPSLRKADYGTLPSSPSTQRWYNTACWARNDLVKSGLMRSDSPRGIWEISEAGRNYLADQKP